MQPTNIIYEISSKPIGELAELPAAELAEMQKEVETLIALADNVRKWLNGALMLKYRDRLDAKRRELGRTFGEIRLQEDGLEITEDRPSLRNTPSALQPMAATQKTTWTSTIRFQRKSIVRLAVRLARV